MTGYSSILLEMPFLTLLLISHFLSDFQLQSQETSDKKGEQITYLLKHLLGVALPLILLVFINWHTWWIALLVWTSHALIDYLKLRVSTLLGLRPSISFLGDQFLHLLIIILLANYTRAFNLPNLIEPKLLVGMLFVILITKPTNITFRILFQKFEPKEKDEDKDETVPGAGATIGHLERIVIAICLLFHQFSSIGLVFTAKSIARYNKISENPSFAEYYLIGSLFSILSVLLVAWICFW